MGLMISRGNELVRFNPANRAIEFSTNQGRSWITRCSNSSIGNVRSLISYRGELLLCSDTGIHISTNEGRSWISRCSSNKDLIDLQDCGNEILANTAEGHIYFSTNAGRSWIRRR